MGARPNENFSNWNHRFPGMQQSSDEFYASVQKELERHNLDRMDIRRVNLFEGGVLSSKREYLEIYRSGYVFHLCAAPFGDGFFVSWWCGTAIDWFIKWLAGLPILGYFLRNFVWRNTYYKVDLALMFQSVVSSSVMIVLDQLTEQQGQKALTEIERKPAMRDFLA